MASSNVKRSTRQLIELLLVAGIVVVVMLVSQRIYARIDMTESDRYTLSPASERVLSGLEEVLTIKAFFSENIPPAQQPTLNAVKDTLAEFKAAAGSRLQIEFVNPYKDPDTVQQMRLLGIPELTLTVFGKDELEQRKVYMGIALFYENEKEVIPAVTQIDDLEYGITSAIVKLTGEKKVVGFWLGNPMPSAKEFWEEYQRYDLVAELEPLMLAVRQQYEVREVSFVNGAPVADEIDTLIVVGPRRATDRDIYEIDQFIMRGGNVIFLADIDERNEEMQARYTPSGLEPLLNHYGIRIRPALVADRQCENAPFQTRYFRSVAKYPFWPKVGGEGINRENPALASLQAVSLPWTAPLEPVSENLGERRKFIPLLSSSPFAMAHDLPTPVYGEQQGLLPMSEHEPLVLAAAVTGKFESYFTGKPLPEPVAPAGHTVTRLPSGMHPEFRDEAGDGRIVVVGSSDFVTKQALALFQQLRSGTQNLIFVQNVLDWMTLGEGLIDMRARTAPVHPLSVGDDDMIDRVRLANLLAVPLVVVAFGLVRFLLRRHDQRRYEEKLRRGH